MIEHISVHDGYLYVQMEILSYRNFEVKLKLDCTSHSEKFMKEIILYLKVNHKLFI